MAAISVSLKSKGGLKALVDKLQKDMKGSHVKVGVLATAPARENDEEGGPASNLEIAIYNEFGAPEAGVPERSFLRASFLKHKPDYVQHLETLLKNAVEKGYPIKKGLNTIGLLAASDVKAFIIQGEQVPPPNSPATIREKVEKGSWKITNKLRKRLAKKTKTEFEAEAAGQVRTLVDTGQLVNSLTHEVVMGGGTDS
jgi:hypothetical protein